MNQDCVVQLYRPKFEPYRGSHGTGYLIRQDLILTCRHIILPNDIADDSEEAQSLKKVDVRFVGDCDQKRKNWIQGNWELCWSSQSHDLALLKLTGQAPQFWGQEHQDFVSRIKFSRLAQEKYPVQATGFPTFKKIKCFYPPFQLTAKTSRIGIESGIVDLESIDPIPKNHKEWHGMSGAAIFYENSDYLVGVVVQANHGKSPENLWIKPLWELEDDNDFWSILQVQPCDDYRIASTINCQKDLDDAQVLNDLLLHLNYSDQENEFKRKLDNLDGTGIFLAEIDDEKLQRWMISRLIRNTPVLKGAERNHLKISSFLGKNKGITVWNSFTGNTDSTADSDDLLNKICRKLQRKTLLFTLHKVEVLGEAELRAILCDFWVALQQKIQADLEIEDHKCILLLVGNPGWTEQLGSSLNLQEIACNDQQYWKWGELTDRCIRNWFGSAFHIETAGEFCERLSGNSRATLRSNINRSSPRDAIDSISCRVLGENGLAQLNNYWTLGS